MKVFQKIPTYDPAHHSQTVETLSIPLPSTPSGPQRATSTTTSTISSSSSSTSLLTLEEPAIALPTHILDQQNMPEREPFLSPPGTPKTPRSLQILGEASLASITSSSPSSRLQRQRITKLLHAAQFSHARNTLLTKMQ